MQLSDHAPGKTWLALCVGLSSVFLLQGAQVQKGPTARDLLVDVTNADLEKLGADRVLDTNHPAVVRVMRRLAQVDHGLLARLAEKVALPNESESPSGRLFAVSGIAKVLRTIEIPLDPSRPNSNLTFYLVQVAHESGGTSWIASCEIPEAWHAALPRDNPRCSCDAYFLKWVNENGTSVSLLATRRMAWHPDRATGSVSAGWARLGQARVDVGLLDWVASRAGQNLERDEMMCLWQMISKADRVLNDAEKLPPLDIVKLLQDAPGQEGACFRLVGTVHRVTPVDVRNSPYAQSLGIERYYQLDMFVSLGNRRINLVNKNKSNPMNFDHDFPATVVVASLPPGLNLGVDSGTQVSLPVIFFRLWSYASELSRRADPNGRQVAPLFVGGQVQLIGTDSRQFSNSIGAIVLVGLMIFSVFAGWLWWMSHKERRRRKLPDMIELDASGT